MKKLRLFLLPLLLFLFVGVSAQNIIYVDTDNNNPLLRLDGTTWQRAFSKLQDGIDKATAGDTIWVKRGVYLPTKEYTQMLQPMNPKTLAFVLKSGIAIYGGFVGNETSLNQRVLADTTETVLSGNAYNTDSTGFLFHVMIGVDVNSVTLNGLSIMNANANGSQNDLVFGTGKQIQQSHGGGIFLESCDSINIENVEIKNNYALQGGAGINARSSKGIVLNNVLFDKNIIDAANDKEGGAGMRNESSEASITNALFTNNGCYKTQGGGALRNTDSSIIVIENSIFESNFTLDEDDGGGAIYNLESQVNYLDVTFENNTAVEAGAIYNDNTESVFSNVIFENNSSRDDGGGAMENDKSKIVLSDVVFKDNTTNGDGGAIQNWRSELELNEVTFQGNSSAGNGGAISNWSQCKLFMNNTTFTENSSGENGGAIYNGGGDCEVISTNGLYYLNHAGVSGGAFYTENHNSGGSSVILTNVTVSKNSADTSAGGGFDDGAGNTEVRNSIFHGNYAPRNADVEVPLSMALTSVHYSIFEDEFHIGAGVYSTFIGEVFADTANNDFTLGYLSPALNAGDSNFYNANNNPDLSGITKDINGANRIQGDSIDLGAYETCGNIVTSSVSLSSDIPANNDDTVTFHAAAKNGGSNPIYTWYKNGVIITGETSEEYHAIAGTDIVNHDIIAVTVTTEDVCIIDSEFRDSIIIVITGINVKTDVETKFNIYPNPTNGLFTLDYHGNNAPTTFVVNDITGREVYRKEGISNTTHKKSINLNLNNGLYFFTLIHENGETETLKLIIKK